MSPKPKSGRARSWLSKERKSGLLDFGSFSTDRQLPRIAIRRGGQEILRQDEQRVTSVSVKVSWARNVAKGTMDSCVRSCRKWSEYEQW